jgi:hypothetical protein
MNKLWCLPVLIPALFFSGCGRTLTDSAYFLALPEPPPTWTELLGPPHWWIEWINPEGAVENRISAGGLEITLPQTWASPVSAWPFWPGRGIEPGIFRPAGGIFPFDASGDLLRLSWRGGVDALVYWELDAARAAGAGAEASVPRFARNFNWPRFRELFDDPIFLEKLHSDPWLVDWKAAAAKIALLGFDKRRIVPEKQEEIPVPMFPGPWIGTSPFAPPLVFGEGETPVFPAGPRPGSWFSSGGILRCTAKTWIFLPWPEDY